MIGVYYCVLFLAGLLTMFRFRKMDVPGRLICALIWLGILTEWVGRYMAGSSTSNEAVYQLALVAELVLFALYFNYSIVGFRKRRLGYYIAAFVAVLAAFCRWYLDSPRAFSAFFQAFACLLVLVMAFYAIFDRVSQPAKRHRLHCDFHFWVTVVIVLYECLALLSWGIYNTGNSSVIKKQTLLHVLFELNGIAIYCFLAILLILYPRLKQRLWLTT